MEKHIEIGRTHHIIAKEFKIKKKDRDLLRYRTKKVKRLHLSLKYVFKKSSYYSQILQNNKK